MDIFNYSRRETSEVNIGATPMGGSNPIRIQSMTNTSTQDTDACVAQAKRIVDAGGEYVRLTTQGVKEAENLMNINAALRQDGYMTPLVADVHFNPKVADVAAQYAEKVRINPGNYVDSARTFKHLEYTDEEYAQECYELGETAEAWKHYIYRACGHCENIWRNWIFTILTSISEGQPLSVLESFAARRPCVTTDVGCCRELLEGKEEDVYGKAGYYVAPMYRDGLALAMEKMCESRSRRLRMGKNGQARVKAYYRQERMIRLYRELYEEVIQKNGRNRI